MLALQVSLAAATWLALADSALAASQPAKEQPDLMTIKQRYVNLLAPQSLRATDPAVKRLIARLDRGVDALLRSQIATPDALGYGSWGNTTSRRSEDLNQSGAYFGRVARLGAGYATPGSRHRGDKAVLKRITAALDHVEPFVRPGGPHPGNWWAWDIGIPMRLGDALILVGDDLPAATRDRMVAALLGLVKKRYASSYYGGGANVLWVAMNQLRVALITGRADYARSAAGIAARIAAQKGGMGIQEDASYHFHGHGLNMGYGRAQLLDVSRYAYLTDGTSFALPERARGAHEAWYRDFVVWNAYRGRVSPFTVGRSISRSGSALASVEADSSALLAATPGSEVKGLALGFLKECGAVGPKADFASPTLAALAPQLKPLLVSAEALPTGARFYPCSDYLACRGAGFYAAVRMSSTRTKAWFSIRDENNRGWHTGDGTLVLMTDDSEFDRGVIPTMDWEALSGVTVAPGLRMPAERPGQSTVVGGLAHRGTVGAAGMHFVLERGARRLDACKSYTVFGDAVVLLGTGIRLNKAADNDHHVRTALHQCPLRDADTAALADGRSVPLTDGTSRMTVKRLYVGRYMYTFPRPTKIELRVITTTRDYGHINHWYRRRTPEDQREKYTRRFYTLLVDHGAQPAEGDYAVTIRPESLDDMAAPVDVLTQTRDAHVVKDIRSGTVVGYFFAAGEATGEAAGFAADEPLFFAASREGDGVHLTVQDPTYRGGKRRLRLPDLHLKSADGTQVRPVDGGSEVTVALKRGWPTAVVLSAKQ